MSLDAYLAAREDRCAHGYATKQHPALCDCPERPTSDEWAIFLAALRTATRDGEIHQGNVRPLIRGRVAPKLIGSFYRKAKAQDLIEQVRKEQSDDTAGRNTHHDSPVYAWVA